VTKVLRNKKIDTTPRRPDFSGLYNGVPVLIVKEKEDDDIQGAVNDVINKFVWIPQLSCLPFFIGFAFSFNALRIIKLTKDMLPVTIFFANLTSLVLIDCLSSSLR
jgi:hypothetical protein